MSRSTVRAPITLRLPFAPDSVSVARQHLKSWMSDLDDSGDSIEDARVVISELVANAVRHAQPLSDGGLLVGWALEDERVVQVSVTDGGSRTRPHALKTPSGAMSGRGMAIVEVLAETWWTERSETRSTIHALIPV